MPPRARGVVASLKWVCATRARALGAQQTGGVQPTRHPKNKEVLKSSVYFMFVPSAFINGLYDLNYFSLAVSLAIRAHIRLVNIRGGLRGAADWKVQTIIAMALYQIRTYKHLLLGYRTELVTGGTLLICVILSQGCICRTDKGRRQTPEIFLCTNLAAGDSLL